MHMDWGYVLGFFLKTILISGGQFVPELEAQIFLKITCRKRARIDRLSLASNQYG
jgi:hypothetical protein